jgi:hypothetical protein
VIVGFGLLVGRPAGVVRGAGREGFTTVLVGFADGVISGRVGVAAGALLAGERGMTRDDEAGGGGGPRGVVRAGVDVGFAVLGGGELAGRLLRDAEVLDRDGLAMAPSDDPLGAAARWSGPGVPSGRGATPCLVSGASITTAATTAATTVAAVVASTTMPVTRLPGIPRPDCAAPRAGT